MKHNTLCAATALGLALAAGPALADSSATATFGNVHITLTDLDLTDGITPSITMNFESQPYLNGAVGSYNPGYESVGYAHLGKHADSVVTDTAQTAIANSSATMIGAKNLVGFSSMVVSGTAASTAIGYGEFGALAANYTLDSFFLSANTGITITVDASMNVATTLGYDVNTGMGEHAQSHVQFLIDGQDESGNSIHDEAYQELYVDAGVDNNGNITGAQQSWSGSFSIGYNNLNTNSQLLSFYSEAGVGGASITTAVPEPESYALLLAGIGVIGVVVRRRRV